MFSASLHYNHDAFYSLPQELQALIYLIDEVFDIADQVMMDEDVISHEEDCFIDED